MILVAGATSTLGRLVVPKLAAIGETVRVLVRTDASASDFRSQGAHAAVGDVTLPETLPAALAGTNTVVSLVGRHYARTREILWSVDAEGNKNLIRAAREAGVRHLVLMSLLWTDRDYAPVIIPAKAEAEKALRASGLAYSILRPATFVTGPNSLVGLLGPTIERWSLAFVPRPDSGPISFISTEDLADAIVRIATRPPANRAYELGGSEKLTLREAAEKLGAVLGRTVRCLAIPRAAIHAAKPLLRPLSFGAYESLLFFEMLADHGYHCDAGVLRETLGREPRGVDECLREHYATVKRTPWRDSIYASLLLRSQ